VHATKQIDLDPPPPVVERLVRLEREIRRIVDEDAEGTEFALGECDEVASSSFATSAWHQAARPPARRTSRTVSSPPPSTMSDTATANPSRASRNAMARPEPPPPEPVTMADFPSLFMPGS
jgi:hypothetical protein